MGDKCSSCFAPHFSLSILPYCFTWNVSPFNPVLFHVEHYFSRCFTWNTKKRANSLILNYLNKFDELHKNIDIKLSLF